MNELANISHSYVGSDLNTKALFCFLIIYQCIEVAVGSCFVGLEKILFRHRRSLVGVALLRVGGALLGVGVALLPVATVLRSDMVLVVWGNVVVLIR